MQYEDGSGPTAERLKHAGFDPRKPGSGFFTIAGRSKSTRRVSMLDDALGRCWLRQTISAAEYSALRKYALHWLAGGLQGHLGSVDLNRVLAFDPHAMTGLAKTERQADHRAIYHAARDSIGARPAFVADHIACFDTPVADVGRMLGYQSKYHGRSRALEILSDAGYRLGQFWEAH